MYFDWHQCLIWMAKLLLAALLGGAVGFERETHGQAAGLRTNLLVSTGSCLLMMLSLHLPEMFQALDATSNLRIDPGRIASYAVAGMGFLGGGAILKGKGSVRGGEPVAQHRRRVVDRGRVRSARRVRHEHQPGYFV